MGNQMQLIALDMDGTLLNSQGEVSIENREAIRAAQDRGVEVTFATGRGMDEIKYYAHMLNVNEPIVSINGSVIWKNRDVIWKQHTLQAKWIEKMLQLAGAYNSSYWGHSSQGGFQKEDFIEDIYSVQWYKFGFEIHDDVARAAILQTLHEWDHFQVSNSSPFNIEVNPKGVHKAQGLIEICRLKNCTMDNVMAIGDSLNDLQMIQQAGTGIAMGNAQNEVKQVADDVTGSNEEHGVAMAIEKMLAEQPSSPIKRG